MAANWRAELSTPAQKAYYIRTVMGIEGAKSSKEYRNVYRYLDLVATGKRSGEKSAKLADVRVVAEIAAERKQKGIATPLPTATGAAHEYQRGDVIRDTVYFSMSADGRRMASGEMTLSNEIAISLANGGQLLLAWLVEYMGEEAAVYAYDLAGHVS